MWIVIVIVGLIFGIFAFSQIIYPLFFAWPRAKQLEREGKLIKPIPIVTFIVPPIIWGILLIGSIWFINNYFAEYSRIYYIVLGFTFIVVVVQIPKQNKDLEEDFKYSWRQYLKEE
jgi:protein-S-isoprenylcysteine O-methyltransferase Ste14